MLSLCATAPLSHLGGAKQHTHIPFFLSLYSCIRDNWREGHCVAVLHAPSKFRPSIARQACEGPASDHIYSSPGMLFTLFQWIPAFKMPDGISQKGFLVSSNPGSESMPGDHVHQPIVESNIIHCNRGK